MLIIFLKWDGGTSSPLSIAVASIMQIDAKILKIAKDVLLNDSRSGHISAKKGWSTSYLIFNIFGHWTPATSSNSNISWKTFAELRVTEVTRILLTFAFFEFLAGGCQN